MRIIFACAGTGGHVNPAIAMAKIVLKNEPNSKFLFIGTENGIENNLVNNAGFDIRHISTGKIIRSFTFRNLKAVVDTYRGIGQARKIIMEFKPDLVIGTGGYICGPVMLAAKKLNIPYILHESNAFPGVSVKLLAKNAKCVMIGFKEAKERLKRKDNVLYTGTPAKFDVQSFDSLDKEACKRKLGLNSINKKIVLVTCGSQGAKSINETVLKMVDENPSEKYFVVLVTGKNSYDEMLTNLKNIEKKHGISLNEYIRIEKFIFNMDEMYKASDMCVTRAGAMTVTELAITAKPAILIPLPSAAENHQLYNAKVLENAGAGKIIEQKNLNENILNSTILEMISNDNIAQMSTNARKLVINGVDEKIYKCIKESIKK